MCGMIFGYFRPHFIPVIKIVNDKNNLYSEYKKIISLEQFFLPLRHGGTRTFSGGISNNKISHKVVVRELDIDLETEGGSDLL